MKKYLDITLKVIFSLILLLPIVGALGLFPPPTADMYQTPEAFQFIVAMMGLAAYIDYMMAVVCAVTLVLLWTKRGPLAALLITPITANVVAFHLFLDGGLLTMGALMGNIMALINLYFLWQYRDRYRFLLRPTD